MEDVVAPVLHNKLPVAVVDKVEVQLSTSDTVGADGGAVFGAKAEPGELGHKFTVVVTLYVPAVDILMAEDVCDVLQSKDPVAVVDNVDDPLQLFTIVIEGAAGVNLGADVTTPALLVQPALPPYTVWVTL
jgi:hypothetical protein